MRVSLGGHDVPETTIRRRWQRGLRSLFADYMPVVDSWVLLDSTEGLVRRVAEGSNNPLMRLVIDAERWDSLRRLALPGD